MKNNECGRSMIEMLGVLAIVGILSASGIAEFSKAMSKYKFDRSLATYTMFIQDVMKYQKTWNRAYYTQFKSPGAQYFIIDHIVKFGLKPESWTRIDNKHFMDESKCMHVIDARGNNHIEFQYSLSFLPSVYYGERSRRCVKIVSDIIKPLENLYYLQFWKGGMKFGPDLYGKLYCTKGKVCLTDLTLSEIYDHCTFCLKQNSTCGIVYSLK